MKAGGFPEEDLEEDQRCLSALPRREPDYQRPWPPLLQRKPSGDMPEAWEGKGLGSVKVLLANPRASNCPAWEASRTTERSPTGLGFARAFSFFLLPGTHAPKTAHSASLRTTDFL